jgi:hypothetical protein
LAWNVSLTCPEAPVFAVMLIEPSENVPLAPEPGAVNVTG